MGEYDPIDDNASMTKKGWLTAILELGAWVGTLLSGFLAETLSRKYGIIVACFVFLIGVVIQAVSTLPRAASSRVPSYMFPNGVTECGPSRSPRHSRRQVHNRYVLPRRPKLGSNTRLTRHRYGSRLHGHDSPNL
ncbi:MFS transporter [Candidatus Bathyarchaeota archaeon]|nr:MFS transporter [Candidatus Bathyarchaeota archaeon]